MRGLFVALCFLLGFAPAWADGLTMGGGGGGSGGAAPLITMRAPTATDDSTKGYATNQVWIRQDTGESWTCLGAVAGAAAWEKTNLASGRLLDAVPTAVAAYGVTLLRAAYAGKAFQIKRASDSTTLDIGFVGDQADWESAYAFIVGTTGVFSIWYDQSGNANDATGDTTSPMLSPNALDGGQRGITFIYSTGTLAQRMHMSMPVGVAVHRQAYSVVVAWQPSMTSGVSYRFALGNSTTFNLNDNYQVGSSPTNAWAVYNTAYNEFLSEPIDLQTIVVSSGTGGYNLLMNDRTATSLVRTDQAFTGGMIGDTPAGLTGTAPFVGEMLTFVVYGRELTSTERTNAKLAMYNTFRISPQVLDRLVIAADSIGERGMDYAMSWPRQTRSLITARPYSIYDLAFSGQTYAYFITNYSTTLAPLYNTGVRNMLLITLGTNDIGLNSTSAAALHTLAVNLVALARATGFGPIGVATIMPSTGDGISQAAFEAVRLAFNALLRADAAGADFVSDIGGDPTMGNQANLGNTALWIDGVHLAGQGASFVAEVHAAAINKWK